MCDPFITSGRNEYRSPPQDSSSVILSSFVAAETCVNFVATVWSIFVVSVHESHLRGYVIANSFPRNGPYVTLYLVED
jgi:hypothetical protein